MRCGEVGRRYKFACAAGVTVQAGVDGFGQTEHGRGYAGSDEGAYAVVDKVVFRVGVAVGVSVVDEEVAAEDDGSVMGRCRVGIVGGADADDEVGGIGGNGLWEHFVFFEGTRSVDSRCHKVFDAADYDVQRFFSFSGKGEDSTGLAHAVVSVARSVYHFREW